jgi:hypothetical protein
MEAMLAILLALAPQTVAESLAAAHEAARADQFEAALAHVKTAEETAARLKSPELAARAKEAKAKYAALAKEFEAVKKAVAGGDGGAQAKWDLLVKQDPDALRHLAKSSDKALAQLAELELNKADPLRVADWWLAQAKKGGPVYGQPMTDRAVLVYREAFQKSSGLEREKLRMKLKAIAACPEKPAKGASSSTGWTAWKPGTVVDDSFAREGRKSLRLSPVPDNWSGVATEKVLVQPEYQVSAWFFMNAADGKAEVAIRYWGLDGKFLGQEGISVAGDMPIWTLAEKSVRPVAGVASVDFLVSYVGKTGSVWVDGVEIRAGEINLVPNGGFER